MTVVLAGVGDTAPPQVPLSISEQDNVIAIWSAIAKAGGATSVRVDPAPLSGPAPAHVPAVLLVPVPASSRSWTPPTNSSRRDLAAYRVPRQRPCRVRAHHHRVLRAGRREGRASAARPVPGRHPSARIELAGDHGALGSLTGAQPWRRRRANTVKAVLGVGAAAGPDRHSGPGLVVPRLHQRQGPDGTLLPGPADTTGPSSSRDLTLQRPRS